MNKTMMVRGLLAVVLFATAVTVRASAIPIATVPVGNAGNAADTHYSPSYGAVGYNYNIGTYDVTLNQYAAFLNSMAATDTYGLYNPRLATDLNVAGISRTGLSGSYSYSVVGDGQRPVTYVSWYDAVRFVNWLGTGNTESGAYSITGGGVTVPTTAQRAAWSLSGSTVWYLPDENEWYKAAYYDPTIAGSNKYWTYPTRNNNSPSNVLSPSGTNNANFYDSTNGYTVTQSTTYSSTQNYLTDVGAFAGSPGPNGTFDQGGDVGQWNDLNPDVDSSLRGLNGGGSYGQSSLLAASSRGTSNPTAEGGGLGFRVASSVAVPEPGSLALLLAGAVGLLAFAWRRARA